MPKVNSWLTLVIAIVLLLLVAYLMLRKFFRRLGKKLPDNAITWRQYLRGQGTLLFVFLLLGGVVSWGSWGVAHFGPGLSSVDDSGSLTEYRDLNPSEHPIFEDLNAKEYQRITVMTRTTAPENALAVVVIYDGQDEKTKGEIKRIDSTASTWSRWDYSNANRNLSLVIDSSKQSDGLKATKMDVLIYLSKK